ncbi:MAG: acyl carrier protein [bacterium]|nr:acyl carrier protein [bacterium]
MTALERVLEENPVQVGLFDVDWAQWATLNSKAAASSRFRQLIGESGSVSGHSKKQQNFLRQLGKLEPSERIMFAAGAIRDRLAKVFRIPASKIDFDRRLNAFGLDSLMALEIQNALKEHFGLGMTMVELLKGPSIMAIAEKSLQREDA